MSKDKTLEQGAIDDEDELGMTQKRQFEFTQGDPSTLSCWTSVKLTTRQYENISYGLGLALTLKKDADVGIAEQELSSAVDDMLRPKIQAVRKKYPV